MQRSSRQVRNVWQGDRDAGATGSLLPVAPWVALLALLAIATSTRADVTVLAENFATDPIVNHRAIVTGDPARFAYSGGTGAAVTAHYNTDLPGARLAWPLGRTLTQNNAFGYQTTFTIKSAGFVASTDASFELTFGLLNSVTTGLDRDQDTAAGAYDQVAVDYFPNLWSYGGPSLSPTVIESPATGKGLWDQLKFDYGQETLLNDPGEPGLPLDTALTAQVVYTPGNRTVTLRIIGPSGALPINMVGDGGLVGGWDGDITTVQTVLPADAVFAVDSFGLSLWQDHTTSDPPQTLVADVAVTTVTVTAATPEPASAALLALGAVVLLRRRRG